MFWNILNFKFYFVTNIVFGSFMNVYECLCKVLSISKIQLHSEFHICGNKNGFEKVNGSKLIMKVSLYKETRVYASEDESVKFLNENVCPIIVRSFPSEENELRMSI